MKHGKCEKYGKIKRNHKEGSILLFHCTVTVKSVVPSLCRVGDVDARL